MLTKIARNNEGFLLNLADWQPQLAVAIAAEENIILTDRHWKIINILREFYAEYNHSPTARALIKILNTQAATNLNNNANYSKPNASTNSSSNANLVDLPNSIDPNSSIDPNHANDPIPEINSLYLLELFPKGVATQANKIAGLPKPVHCI